MFAQQKRAQGLCVGLRVATAFSWRFIVLAVAAVGVAVYGLLLLAFRGITPSEIKAALRRRPGDVAVSPDL